MHARAEPSTLTPFRGPCRARFPWYDFPFVHDEYRRLWTSLASILSAAGLPDLPQRLDEGDLDELLTSPALMLSQTCGYDIAVERPAPLTVVAAPTFAVPGCSPGAYFSVLIVRATSGARRITDVRAAHLVANDPRSWSGYHCLRPIQAHIGACSFRGSHLSSVAAVAAGEADLAAIDVVSWTFLARHRPDLTTQVRVIGRTASAPAPPFVTARHRPRSEVQILREALGELTRREPALCRYLLLTDFVEPRADAYAFMKDAGWPL